MQRIRAIHAELCEIVAFDEIQLHQQFDAAARRRRIAVNVVASIRRVDRLGPLRLVRGQIGRRQRTMIFLEEPIELLSDVAFIETVKGGVYSRFALESQNLAVQSLLLGLDGLSKRRRQIWISPKLARLRGATIREKNFGRRRKFFELRFCARDSRG